jgi:hypothetical protein
LPDFSCSFSFKSGPIGTLFFAAFSKTKMVGGWFRLGRRYTSTIFANRYDSAKVNRLIRIGKNALSTFATGHPIFSKGFHKADFRFV